MWVKEGGEGKGGIEGEASATKMAHCLKSIGAVKGVGAAGDQSGLVNGAFGEAVGLSAGNVGQDPVFVMLDGSCDSDEPLQTRARGPRDPQAERLRCPTELQVVERFLEQVSAVERAVVQLDRAEAEAVPSAEVLHQAWRRFCPHG